ncbi:MAG TPA: CHAT domain-containing protein [Blastocatellia bacterium]|nr:CHAT domain-containing protein [Blastocatellia bacterium]
MPRVKHDWVQGVILACCLSPFAFAQDDSRAQSLAPASSDEAARRAVVEKFSAAYGSKDLAQAESEAERAALLANKRELVQALIRQGDRFFSQGDYPQALDVYARAHSAAEQINDKAGISRTLNYIGLIRLRQGNYAQAMGYFQQSLAMSEAMKDKTGMADALVNIGNVHRKQGDYAQAMEYYRKSLAMSETLEDKVIMARTLNNIANVYRKQGRYEQSLEFAGRAAAPARQVGLLETLWGARLLAGAAHHFLNRPDQARQAIAESIAATEALRAQVAGGEQEQQRFFESRVLSYYAMVELLVAQNNPAEALAYAERARARALLDVLRSGRINITKAMTSQEQEQERRLNSLLVSLNTQIYRENLRPQPDPARLAELNAQLQKARLDFEAFQTNLYVAHPELKTQRGEAPPLRLEEATALLPDTQTALLEFVVAAEKSYLFVLTRQGAAKHATVKVFPLEVKQQDLTERVERFRQMLATLDNRFHRSAREFYDLLLKPAAAQLRGKTRLVLVPDGPLWELPFQALQTPQNRYLIEDHIISYAPSLTVLREMRRSRRREASAAPTLLAFGNPALEQKAAARVQAALMYERLDPLPEAERQVQTLGRLYGPRRSKVYIGAEAREERFKAEAGAYRILHLATHGILNDRSPMYSHLLLAQAKELTFSGAGSKEDGLLEAWELLKMDLRADLAVLSACETARGRVGQGEGMIGLTWALFVAGVPTTVVSQWQVRSDSTAELMVAFHQQLQTRLAGSPGRGAAAALRAAALKLMQNPKYRHPFHWAGFVVVGNGY